MKKRIAYLAAFAIALISAALIGCFSPWTGEKGNITIDLGGGSPGSGRVMVDQTEISGLVHTITLKGTGGTITKTVTGGGQVTFGVTPGRWTVEVRAVGNTPETYNNPDLDIPFPATMLRAIGTASVNVKGGGSTTVPVIMLPATEVTSWAQLCEVVNMADTKNNEEIILIANDLTPNYDSVLIGGSDDYTQKITIMADKVVTINRANPEGSDPLNDPFIASFFNVKGGSTLTLGKPGMAGTVTLDGGNKKDTPIPNVYSPLIEVDNGYLVMNSGVSLQNNTNTSPDSAGAVLIYPSYTGISAAFTMNGGTISGNSSYAVNSSSGGVCVVTGGIFTMKGGTINNNTALGAGNGVMVSGGKFIMSGGTIEKNGTDKNNSGITYGAVFVDNGTFDMSGGVIRDNGNENVNGGGVYVRDASLTMSGNASIIGNYALVGGGVYVYAFCNDGTLTMNGGTISGNIATQDGGGVYIFNSNGYFKMTSGAITGNTAAVNGGGVAVIGGSSLSMSGNASIANNNAKTGGGVYQFDGASDIGGGSITGNTAVENGGGVFIGQNGAYTMFGGSIANNTATGNGGGVYIDLYGSLEKLSTGGVIYGSKVANSNNAVSGAAVYAMNSVGPPVFIETTIDKGNTYPSP